MDQEHVMKRPNNEKSVCYLCTVNIAIFVI